MHARWFLLAAAIWLAPASVHANVKPHALCSDGMVLQQKSTVNLWGTADKGEKVSVQFRGKEASATADESGKWLVSFESGDAGGPFPMTISGDANKLGYKDVYVGEVWICSGQSNMQWSINACSPEDIAAAKATPANPMLRLFSVPRAPTYKPQDNVNGAWSGTDPSTKQGQATLLNFSAVGFFFGRDLQKATKVPVGLFNTNYGGTRAEAWTSKSELDAHPMFKHEHAKFGPAYELFMKDPAELLKVQQAEAEKAKKKAPQKVENPLKPNAPSGLYNAMIHPLLNYRIRGAIWYQGESNTGNAHAYRTLHPLMIENWRKDWKQPDFPFYFVQLAPFTPVAKQPGESDWAELREAQLMTLKLKNTGMAVITDLGHEQDIHPTPKVPVGERLALIARAQIHGEKLVYSGPIYQSMKVDGNKAVLSFEHVGRGLTSLSIENTKDEKGRMGAWRVKEGSTGAELVGFTICSEDKKFVAAKATIVGDTVVVQSDTVVSPVAVRFGWSNHPVCNLFNREGLPASPFRTDRFPGVTQPKQ